MIPILKPFMPQDVELGITEILYSGKLSYGKQARLFEKKLKKFVNNDLTLTLSCNSIYFALKLLELKENDEVIVSPMCCLMTSQPIANVGAKTIWCDIDPLTGTLDPDNLKKKISVRTKAIIHYHWSGNIGYIDEVIEIANEKGIPVIEDVSESFGAKYKNKIIGNTKSDITCYSFTPARIPNALNSSGISFSNKKLFEKAKLRRDLGINRINFRDDLNEININCDISTSGDSNLIDEITGFVGAKQIEHIHNLINYQREIAQIWYDFIENNEGFSTLKNRTEVEKNYWTFTILSNERDKLLNDMREKGIYATKLHVRNDYYSLFGNLNSDLIGVKKFSDTQLSLPCGWWVNKMELRKCLNLK